FLNQISPKNITWCKPNTNYSVYLTFDDGPHPEITPWILSELKNHDAKATFFCLGENALKYPFLIKNILDDGHTIGNHGYLHLKASWFNTKEYLHNFEKGKAVLKDVSGKDINYFRPPYGAFYLQTPAQIILWTLMPGDFDTRQTKEKCLSNLLKCQSGDIIVLHDNEKSFPHLKYSLPLFLEQNTAFNFQAL
ncbi:MAG TPA: polysaccharide deacetylase family protein, partial [Chitinophagales bacterium]|nr:polysaccharide deacetylase family protein [Chitinophagales bacterium]